MSVVHGSLGAAGVVVAAGEAAGAAVAEADGDGDGMGIADAVRPSEISAAASAQAAPTRAGLNKGLSDRLLLPVEGQVQFEHVDVRFAEETELARADVPLDQRADVGDAPAASFGDARTW